MNDNILEILEKLRIHMDTDSVLNDLGIPRLDPLTIKEFVLLPELVNGYELTDFFILIKFQVIVAVLL